MSLLQLIIDSDLDSTMEYTRADEYLKEVNKKFYSITASCEEEVAHELEDVFGQFTARCMRIAYTCGLRDASEMMLDLQMKPLEILEKYSL